MIPAIFVSLLYWKLYLLLILSVENEQEGISPWQILPLISVSYFYRLVFTSGQALPGLLLLSGSKTSTACAWLSSSQDQPYCLPEVGIEERFFVRHMFFLP